jgi:CheY-like chemotaxis protein/pSer/pThr/pTyr-binding forkhead associated (FHA) protein
MPTLLVRHPEQGDLTFALSGTRITVGRHSDNTIQIRHTTVSAHHAEIVEHEGNYVIRDLDSTNHSYIGGVMFIEAPLVQPCRLVLGTVECDFVPDNVEVLPDETDALRKNVGLLRRQNDELIAKIVEQKNQIEILSNVKLLTRGATSELSSVREQVKELAQQRDSLLAENKAFAEELHELRALTGRSAVVARRVAGGISGGGFVQSVFVAPMGGSAISPSPLAVLPAPPLDSPFYEVASLNGKLRTLAAALTLHPADRKTFDEVISHAKEMCRIAAILGQHPVAIVAANLDALLQDAGQHSGPASQRTVQTAAQTFDFLSRLLTHDVLSRAEKLPQSRVIAVDDDSDLLSVIVATLESAHLATTGCTDARAALDALQENSFDVILLDIGLPDMNGLDMCARIHALPKHNRTPILLITGDDSVHNRERSVLNGACDLIGKPFNMFELTLKAHTWALKNRLELS